MTPDEITADCERFRKSLHDTFAFETWQEPVIEAAVEQHRIRLVASADITEHGATVLDRFGQRKPNPSVAIGRAAAVALSQILRSMKLEPDPEGVR